MARPKNEKLKAEILDAARAQFLNVGYKATSYASVSTACGITRELVQYHFPKKELLAIAVMEQQLAEAQAALALTDDQLRGDYRAITQVGVQFFRQLLADEGSRRFLQDVVSSRELTETVLAFNMDWCLQRVDVPAGFDGAAVEEAVILRMGGFYELLYHCLKRGTPLDLEAQLRGVVDAFREALG